jgi:hypothetical protein
MQSSHAGHPGAHPLSPAKPGTLHRYRCYLQHSFAPSDTGVLPFVQLRARTAELAARLALAVSGALAVVEVIRLEDATCAG